MEERRAGRFSEKLSTFMVVVAALGALFVLLDIKLMLPWITFGSMGFSADLKGAVISAILIGGWNSVKEYWLGSSAGSEKKSDAIQKMVDAAPAVTAAAVAAAVKPTEGVKQ